MVWMVKWWDCIGDIIALMVGWLERMHGRDTALNGGSCNATTMHPLHHQQFNQIFPLFPSSSFGNLHQVSLQRFSSWLAVEYPSRFPHNLSCRQLKDKSLWIEIVEIKIPWCVCAGSPTPLPPLTLQFPRSIPILARGSIRASNSNTQIHIQSTQQQPSGDQFISGFNSADPQIRRDSAFLA